MKKSLHFLLLYLSLLACNNPAEAPAENAPPKPQKLSADLWIQGGTIIDGSGGEAFGGDVLIKDQQIIYLGKTEALEVEASQTIDAQGMLVSPGFIDAHSHGGTRNNLAQGVTTLCLGQDGNSGALASLHTKLESENLALALNEAWWVGHGSLRSGSGVGTRKDPGIKLIDGMREQLSILLHKGAFGLSTGLEYVPGMYADQEELLALATAVGQTDGVMVSHMRNEDDDQLFAAIDELAACGERCRVHVSHLKSVYGKGEARAQEIIAYLDQVGAQTQGLTADLYPYTASYTTIGIVFPEWARPPADYPSVRHSREKELAAYLRERVNKRNGPAATLFGSKAYAGKTLAQVAREQNRPFEEVLMDIGPRGASAAYFVMDDELQKALTAWPQLMISSDGSETMHHPRGFGSFTKVLSEWSLEDQIMSLEKAIYKMTGLPAATFGFENRGLLKEGYYADIAIFKPEALRSSASFIKPHRLAEGMHLVLINGQIVWQNQEWNGKKAGQLLKKRSGN
ncbi:MAG: amidohydrolase family protein [Bacteroidota bacterium]